MLAHVITQEEELDFPLSTLLIKKFDIFVDRFSKNRFWFVSLMVCVLFPKRIQAWSVGVGTLFAFGV